MKLKNEIVQLKLRQKILYFVIATIRAIPALILLVPITPILFSRPIIRFIGEICEKIDSKLSRVDKFVLDYYNPFVSKFLPKDADTFGKSTINFVQKF